MAPGRCTARRRRGACQLRRPSSRRLPRGCGRRRHKTRVAESWGCGLTGVCSTTGTSDGPQRRWTVDRLPGRSPPGCTQGRPEDGAPLRGRIGQGRCDGGLEVGDRRPAATARGRVAGRAQDPHRDLAVVAVGARAVGGRAFAARRAMSAKSADGESAQPRERRRGAGATRRPAAGGPPRRSARARRPPVRARCRRGVVFVIGAAVARRACGLWPVRMHPGATTVTDTRAAVSAASSARKASK